MLKRLLTPSGKIPPEVLRFLWKALALFIGWKLLYSFVLSPRDMPDAFLTRQLGNGTALTMNWFYRTSDFTALHIKRYEKYGSDSLLLTTTMVQCQNCVLEDGRKITNVLGIFRACNGLELMILYAGFILCFSGSFSRKLIFIIGGIIGLYLLNVFRCMVLGYVVLEHTKHFDIAHKYFFNTIVYALTFLLWVYYVKGLTRTEQKNDLA